MRRTFYKMHGIGNDYVYFNCMKKSLPYPERLAIRLSDRHFSVGGDGIILISKSKIADVGMRIFNADGSEGRTCGNGLRCVGKLVYDRGWVKKRRLTVETKAGISTLDLMTDSRDEVRRVCVTLRGASFRAADVPAYFTGEAVERKLLISGHGYTFSCLSVGNPHVVVFGEMPADVEGVGRAIQRSGYFPQGVNVEFVEAVSRRELRVRVCERGSGETLACGSGACAAAAAAVRSGICRGGEDILVRLRGGTLTVRVEKDKIFLTGDAVLAYTGRVEI